MELPFNKVAGLKACNFIKKRIQQRCFPMKFLKTPFLQNISGGCFLTQLLLHRKMHFSVAPRGIE